LIFYGLVVLVSISLSAAAKKSYEGYALYQVHPDTEAKENYLLSLYDSKSGLEVQIWRASRLTKSFDILVSPQSKAAFLKELDNRQIRYELKNENIQKDIDEENNPSTFRSRGFPRVQNANQFTKFLTLDETNKFMQSLATNYPNIVKVEQIGSSIEGRPINVVKVGSDNGSDKPSIWIDGGIHSEEWIAVSTVTFMLNKLVTEYATDPKIKNYVDKANWYFVPVLNVDGYEFTHTEERLWRKNRRPNEHLHGCEGVDLNRNFDYAFGARGEQPSVERCQQDYRGASAFSEPETQAVRDFVLKHMTDMKAFMTLHTYSQMWFYPYSDKRGSYPEDVKELEDLSKKAAEAIKAVHGAEFRVGTPADILYTATGTSFDWAKSVAKVKYCVGMELRPKMSLFDEGQGFVLPPSNIVPAGEETWAGISVVADEVIRQFAH